MAAVTPPTISQIDAALWEMWSSSSPSPDIAFSMFDPVMWFLMDQAHGQIQNARRGRVLPAVTLDLLHASWKRVAAWTASKRSGERLSNHQVPPPLIISPF